MGLWPKIKEFDKFHDPVYTVVGEKHKFVHIREQN